MTGHAAPPPRVLSAIGSMALLLGCVLALHAQDQSLTPYEAALLDYKTGQYDAARAAIDTAETAKPGDPATEILKARILTEQGDFATAKKTLEGLNGNPGLTGDFAIQRTMAFGDMNLHKRNFFEAAKFYESLLPVRPHDPDLILKIVYARIGANDLLAAAKNASTLKPLDPDHPSYYFANAALAQATGKGTEAEDDIQTARTIYGITVTNRYLKTYLEVFAKPDKNPPDAVATPVSGTNAVPTGIRP